MLSLFHSFVCYQGHAEIVSMLLEAGCEKDVADKVCPCATVPPQENMCSDQCIDGSLLATTHRTTNGRVVVIFFVLECVDV